MNLEAIMKEWDETILKSSRHDLEAVTIRQTNKINDVKKKKRKKKELTLSNKSMIFVLF